MSKYSSYKDFQLMTENWRTYLQEAEKPAVAAELMNLPLAQFIKQIQVKPHQAAILGGLNDGDRDDDRFVVNPATLVCRDLRPTQNEVVVSKSLEFSILNPKHLAKYRASNGPFKVGKPGNDAIVTFGGKFVIDGHHRWSSLYCCNPNAKIHAFNISKPGEDAADVLKAAQASILALLGKIPANKGGGINLFTIQQSQLKEWMQNLLQNNEQLLPVYKQYLQQQEILQEQTMVLPLITAGLMEIFWPNVEILKTESPPISGATRRPLMPQTDKVGNVTAGGELPGALAPLVKGQINVEEPYNIQRAAEE